MRVRDARGRQVQRSAATLAEAQTVHADLTSDGRRGVLPDGRLTLEAYAATWGETFRGRTGHGIRPATLKDDRADLSRHVIPELGRMRLSEIAPADGRGWPEGWRTRVCPPTGSAASSPRCGHCWRRPVRTA